MADRPLLACAFWRVAAGVALCSGAAAAAQESTPADGRPFAGDAIPPVVIELDFELAAEGTEPPEEEAKEAPEAPPLEAERTPGRLVAAGWCAVRSGSAAEGDEPGCDVGFGASFWTHPVGGRGWLSVVVLVGAESFAVGGAWTVLVVDRPVSVGVGVMLPHGGGVGIYLDGTTLAVGATFGIGGQS